MMVDCFLVDKDDEKEDKEEVDAMEMSGFCGVVEMDDNEGSCCRFFVEADDEEDDDDDDDDRLNEGETFKSRGPSSSLSLSLLSLLSSLSL